MKALKWVVNIMRGIIILYLIVLTFVSMLIYVKKNTFHEKYPTIAGYSYYKIDNATLEPEIRKNNYLFMKPDDDIDVGDFVGYLDGPNQDLVIRKVVERENYKLTLDVTNNYENKNLRVEKNIDDIAYKVTYSSTFVSTLLNILLNPIVIVVLLFLGSIFPELLFSK